MTRRTLVLTVVASLAASALGFEAANWWKASHDPQAAGAPGPPGGSGSVPIERAESSMPIMAMESAVWARLTPIEWLHLEKVCGASRHDEDLLTQAFRAGYETGRAIATDEGMTKGGVP